MSFIPKYGYTKKGFSSIGYTSEDYDAYWSDVNLRKWRPRLRLYDYTATQLLHTYNPFTTNDLKIEHISTQEELGNTGSFSFLVHDNERNIDRSKVGNANKVIVEIGQHQHGPWIPIMSGYIENMKVMRDRLNGLRFGFSGFGSGVIIEETLNTFRKAAYPLNFGSAIPDTNDPNMKICNLFRTLMTETDHLVSSKVSIKDKGNFDLSLISDAVDAFIPDIKTRYESTGSTFNSLAERGGAYWGVNARDQLWLWHPGTVFSGVTLKTFKRNEKPFDKMWNTSYFFGPWEYSMPINSDNFANVLVSISGTEPKPGDSSTDTGGDDDGTPIGGEEPVQEVPVTIPDLSMIGVILKKIGPITQKFVNGFIYANLNGKPSKDHIATFRLDLSHLFDDIAGAVYTQDIRPTSGNASSQIQVGNSVFISLQNNTINIQNGQGNNIIWMHNGQIIINNPKPSGSRPNTNPVPGEEGKPPFVVQPDSSTYTYATFYNTRTKVIVKDPVSIERYGEVERFVNIDWTKDFRTINDILMLMLDYTAKPKMIFNVEKVSIPNPAFQVGTTVSVVDDISGLNRGTNTLADIVSVGYEFDAYDNDSAIGTYFCDLGIGSIYDFLTYEEINVDSIRELDCRPPLL